MNKNSKSRRHFIKSAALGFAGVSATGLLTSCASFDDYLFDDKSTLTDEVVIIGGGIAGLYLAHRLRAKQVEFKLFEASGSLGGRVKSFAGRDYGASILNKSDLLAGELLDELKINKVFLDKENYFVSEGMESLIDVLKDRVLGLIPYRNFRLRWQLVEVQKVKSEFELTFQLAQGQKKVHCRRLAVALPPSQWAKIKGLLDLPEMDAARNALVNLQTENVIRLILPTSSLQNTSKPILEIPMGDFSVRQVIKKHHNILPVELDVRYAPNLNFSIDYVYGELKKKLQINYPFQKLNTDQYYSWQQANFIQGAHFKLNWAYISEKTSPFQLLGDAVASAGANRIEGALQSARAAADAYI